MACRTFRHSATELCNLKTTEALASFLRTLQNLATLLLEIQAPLSLPGLYRYGVLVPPNTPQLQLVF